MIPLRQNTASQEIVLGPFLDSSDGDATETGLTIANTDILLHKTGGTTLPTKTSGGATHISNGIYYAVLDATDTNTAGSLTIFCHVSGALAVKLECTVYPEPIYDANFVGSMILGTVSGSPSTTSIPASDLPAGLDNDNYVGRVIIFLTGSLVGQATDVTAYNGTTKILTVTALTSAPSVSDTFLMV